MRSSLTPQERRRRYGSGLSVTAQRASAGVVMRVCGSDAELHRPRHLGMPAGSLR